MLNLTIDCNSGRCDVVASRVEYIAPNGQCGSQRRRCAEQDRVSGPISKDAADNADEEQQRRRSSDALPLVVTRSRFSVKENRSRAVFAVGQLPSSAAFVLITL